MAEEGQSSELIDQKPKNARRRLIFKCLRIAVSLGLIGAILYNTDFSAVSDALANAQFSFLIGAVALQILGVLIISLRFQVLLSVKAVRPALATLFISTLSSAFFRQFLPSTFGGDALRGYDAWKAGASKSFTVLALFVDRLLGLAALLTLLLLALFVIDAKGMGLEIIRVWAVVGFCAIGVLILILFSRRGSVTAGNSNGSSRLDSKPAAILKKVSEAVQSFAGQRTALIKSYAYSICLQLNVILFYWIIAQSLSISVPFLSFFIIVPVTVFVMLAPITINGIGLREVVFVYVLSFWGVDGAVALAMAWLEFGTVLVLGLIGGITFAMRPSQDRLRL